MLLAFMIYIIVYVQKTNSHYPAAVFYDDMRSWGSIC